MKEEMIRLTKQLVEIKSVNTTAGEKEIGLFIEDYIRRIPYFENHPELVVVQKLKDDPLERRNVFALLKGEKCENGKTLIFHGHTDTVGTKDYGALEKLACSPDQLMEELGKINLGDEIKADLESGDYIFGRGACDMKSGVAVFLVLLKYLSKEVESLSGNILLSCNPVEENLHTGIIEAIDVLYELKEKHDLNYQLAINNDFTCPMYKDDPNHYIYTGTVGKLLPCFYIQGKETHVGQCFEGLDAAALAASLLERIHLNTDFCDGYEGEYSLPPSVLKMKDLKPWYNVQTSKEAFLYFNYFVHDAQTDQIINKLLSAAKESMEDSLLNMNRKYEEFCKLTEKTYTKIQIPYQVLTYEELKELAIKKSGKENISYELDELVKDQEEKGIDKREIPVALCKELLKKAEIYSPAIVLYFAAPYCPHNTLHKEDIWISKQLKEIVVEIEKEYQIKYNCCHFFPSLSDSSYLKIDDSEESIDLLMKNFPAVNHLYPLPINTIRNLDLPAINYGVYGKDAHKWTERVHIPYSFEILPALILKTVNKFLGGY